MLKKFFIIILSVIAFESVNAQYPNSIVRRLSNQEIAECKTPAAITYNFVCAILQKDFVKMMSYVDYDPSEVQEIEEYLQTTGETYETIYSKNENVVALLSWLPALDDGFELVIANIEDFWLAKIDGGWMFHPDQIVKDGMIYIPGEEKPYEGIHEKRVSVICSPSSEVNALTFNDISRYKDNQVEVDLRFKNDKWVVRNFYFISQYKRELIEGTWYLHEVQIPWDEEYDDGILYDKDKVIVLNSTTEEEIVLEEPVLQKDLINENQSDSSSIDILEWNNLLRETSMLSGVDYEILYDTILVLSYPQGYSETVYVKETYEIKQLTKDFLIISKDNTPQGYVIYVYGRKEQPTKYTKHNNVK